MSGQPKEQLKAEEPKLSAKQLKEKAKAEKQARRAAQKDQIPPTPNGVDSQAKGQQTKVQQAKGQQAKNPKQEGGSDSLQKQQGPLPIQRRPSQSGVAPQPPKVPKKENKQVELFSHLYTQPRRHTVEGVSKDVHPAVLALGFQMSSYEICGSSARCVAMLLAFKEAINAYTTPAGTSLARHLTSHYLSPQIDFLKSCRPISESMGNAIRYLKKLIVEIDPSVEEHEAKNYLCEQIDIFIRERITVTDQAIAASACSQIKNGSVVLTYAKSSLVERTVLQAHQNGTRFRIIVVDSRPLYEGKNLARTLMRRGLEVEYVPLSGISHAMKQATLVLLGAHSMLSNGRLQSRIGTASVALHAHKADVPVIVCCESVKFSGKVALDSIVLNEVAPSQELLIPACKPQKSASTGEDEEGETDKTLNDWEDIKNLQILNLMYDVTPAEYIRMVICEYGSLPPSSVPVVHRLANEGGV